MEDHIKKKIPATHCAFYWFIEHAAWLLTVRTIQSDGITAHKRLRGVNFNTGLLGFGEMCLYKLSKSPKDKGLEGKLGVRWKEGVFLGYP